MSYLEGSGLSQNIFRSAGESILEVELDGFCMTEVSPDSLVEGRIVEEEELLRINQQIFRFSVESLDPANYCGGEYRYYIHDLGMNEFFLVVIWSSWGSICDKVWDSSGVCMISRGQDDDLVFYRGEENSGLRRVFS